jgi:acetyl-CoA carboxylase carboxyltransferase component
VIDVRVADEREAVAQTKRLLSYFQGMTPPGEEPDQAGLRELVPDRRRRAYEVGPVIESLADAGSVTYLRPVFAPEMVTALARIEGRPLGIVANNTMRMAGAITSDGADKAARLMQLCDAFGLPIVSLIDTPGMMVGPEAEATALVRHCSRLFVTGASLRVPLVAVILRKAYGLGAIAMAGGSYREPAFTVSWPTGEFGGMGLEGSVKLGYRDELAAIGDPDERRERYEEMVARAYENGKALNQGSLFAVDDTIDPAETRFWVANTLKAAKPPAPREGKKRAFVDGW